MLAALAVVVSCVLGGHRYFYCAQMGEVFLDGCCAGAEPAGQDAPRLERNACCAVGHLAPAGTGIQARVASVSPAPVVASLPVDPAPRSPFAAASSCRAAAAIARAGPNGSLPPDPREHRLRLMISLT